MRRLLIIGASGFIGRSLIQRLCAAADYDLSATYHTRMPQDIGAHGPAPLRWYPADVVDQAQLDRLFQHVRPDVVVHLAAISGIEEAERSPHEATHVNLGGTERIARLCARYQARLVFLSTDYIFSGDRGRYREDELPSPRVHYGKTKWEAEQAIARQLSQWSILRTSMVYGWPPPGAHGNLASGIIRSLESGHPFYGHTDMYRSPIYVGDLVKGMVRLVEGNYQGIYHIAGADWVNMHDFARAVADVFHLDSHLVRPALAPQESKDSRPRLLGLDSGWSAKQLGLKLSDMASGLQQMHNERRDFFWPQCL